MLLSHGWFSSIHGNIGRIAHKSWILSPGLSVWPTFVLAVNSNLRVEIGSPWWAGFISYLGCMFAMLAMAIMLRERGYLGRWWHAVLGSHDRRGTFGGKLTSGALFFLLPRLERQ